MIKECPICDEHLYDHYYVNLVMRTDYGALALKCPGCAELIDVKLNEEGDIEYAN